MHAVLRRLYADLHPKNPHTPDQPNFADWCSSCYVILGHELNEGHPYGQQAKCHNGRLDIRAHGAVSRLYRQDDRSGVIAMSMGSM